MDLILNEVFIGAVVYLALTLVFTSQFIESKFDKIHKEIEEVKRHTDYRDDENEAYIRRMEVILQVYTQRNLLQPPPHDAAQTEIKNSKDS